MNAIYRVPIPINEPIRGYEKGSNERLSLEKRIRELKEQIIDIPIIIGGTEIRTQRTSPCIIPHNKEHVLANYHIAGEKEIKMAIDIALKAKDNWEKLPWEQRLSIFLKTADLLAGPWRDTINAATMLGQSKTAFQAEIDSACELIDFLRFNAKYIEEIYTDQPNSSKECWNRLEYRPLDGFIFAVSPFNFTSIAANLSAAPAMAGNTTVWKPSGTSIYSNYFIMRLFEEAGLPPGVINFVPAYGQEMGEIIFNSPNLGGVHFTGSTKVFKSMWKTVGQNIDIYKSYPRLIGETGGKDFIFAHESADSNALVTAIVRGAFEYQGQKCSAASRAYIPLKLWNEIEKTLIEEVESIKMGETEDFTNFIGAVIDKTSFDKNKNYIQYSKDSTEAKVIVGGNCDDSKGYFVEPTIIVTSNPKFKLMEEEIFGPIITIYVYDENEFEETIQLCDETSPYALTGAIFAQDRYVLNMLENGLRNSAGNFYINDKPTGAVVGQQPFGGARASGTNDKAGSKLNIIRWMSPRTIKENFNPSTTYKYSFMDQ